MSSLQSSGSLRYGFVSFKDFLSITYFNILERWEKVDFFERLEELNEELEQLNTEARELEERIAENVVTLLENEKK